MGSYQEHIQPDPTSCPKTKDVEGRRGGVYGGYIQFKFKTGAQTMLYLSLITTLIMMITNDEMFNNAIYYTVNSRYLDFDYLEQPLISKRKSGPCFNTEI